MSGGVIPVAVFCGDVVHEADALRRDRLLESARVLFPGSHIRALAGVTATNPGGLRQDASAALTHLQELLASGDAVTCIFSSCDTFSVHVARLLAAALGTDLAPTVVRPSACVEAGPLVVVDDRYFFASPSTRELASVCHAAPARDGFYDVPVAAGHAALADAELVFSAGDGVADLDGFVRVAARFGAAVAATKVVCDKGRLPRHCQVGSSGQSIAPRLYVAFGISGSRQHLQGIAPSTRVVAVNVDAHAPMMARAELGMVADANAVLAHLGLALQEEVA